jgi:carboxylate-amine ligase
VAAPAQGAPLKDTPAEDDYLVYTFNRFQACRFGLDGAITHPKTYQTVPLREDIFATLQAMAPHAQVLGSTAAMAHLAQVAERGGDAQRLRQQYHARRSAEAMVDFSIREFRA